MPICCAMWFSRLSSRHDFASQMIFPIFLGFCYERDYQHKNYYARLHYALRASFVFARYGSSCIDRYGTRFIILFCLSQVCHAPFQPGTGLELRCPPLLHPFLRSSSYCPIRSMCSMLIYLYSKFIKDNNI